MFVSRFRCLLYSAGLPSQTRLSLHTMPGQCGAPKSNLAKLRKKTGYSLSLCKQALEKHENDLTKAHEWLKVETATSIMSLCQTI